MTLPFGTRLVPPLLGGALLCGVAAAAEPAPDILAAAEQAGTFTTLLTAIEGSGLADALRGDGPYTLFAPVDDAFEALPEGVVDTLLLPENHDDLVALLRYHIVPGKLAAKDLAAMVEGDGLQEESLDNLDDLTLVIENQTGITVDGAQLLATDIEAGNGIVHAIDTLLLPDAS